MRLSIRTLTALAVSLSMTAMAGCAMLPGLTGQRTGTSAAATAATGRLAFSVNKPGFAVQADPEPTGAPQIVRIMLDTDYQSTFHLQRDITLGASASFDQVPTGRYSLKAALLDSTGNPTGTADQREVEIQANVTTWADLTLIVGGSSALDLGFEFMTAGKNFNELREADGQDGVFMNAQGGGPMNWIQFQLWYGTATASVRFDVQPDPQTGGFHVYRTVNGASQTEVQGIDRWATFVPAHAIYKDSSPVEGFSTVRHYQWSNTFVAPEGATREMRVDRWFTPGLGLVKEELHDTAGGLISRMVFRESSMPAPVASTMPYLSPTPYATPTPAPSMDPFLADQRTLERFAPVSVGRSWSYSLTATPSIERYPASMSITVMANNGDFITLKNYVAFNGMTPVQYDEVATRSLTFAGCRLIATGDVQVLGATYPGLHIMGPKGEQWYAEGVGLVSTQQYGPFGPDGGMVTLDGVLSSFQAQ